MWRRESGEEAGSFFGGVKGGGKSSSNQAMGVMWREVRSFT